MTDPAPTAVEALRATIKEALKIGAISYDGDPWYAASDDGGAGLGYDHCEAAFGAARGAVDELAVLAYRTAADRDVERRLRDALELLDAIQDWDGDISHIENPKVWTKRWAELMEQARIASDALASQPAADTPAPAANEPYGDWARDLIAAYRDAKP